MSQKNTNFRESRKMHKEYGRQSLDRKHFDQDYHPRRLKRRASLVNINEGAILDAGCGDGTIQKYLPKTLEYTGIDFDKNSLTFLWEGRASANRIVGQITQLPFRDNCFDIVLNIEVIEHLLQEWQENLLLELYRTLKKGGEIVLSTPNPETLFHASMWAPPFSPAHFHCVTYSELTKLLKKAGFRLIKRVGDDIIAKYPHIIFKYIPQSFRRVLASLFLKLDKHIIIEARKT